MITSKKKVVFIFKNGKRITLSDCANVPHVFKDGFYKIAIHLKVGERNTVIKRLRSAGVNCGLKDCYDLYSLWVSANDVKKYTVIHDDFFAKDMPPFDK